MCVTLTSWKLPKIMHCKVIPSSPNFFLKYAKYCESRSQIKVSNFTTLVIFIARWSHHRPIYLFTHRLHVQWKWTLSQLSPEIWNQSFKLPKLIHVKVIPSLLNFLCTLAVSVKADDFSSKFPWELISNSDERSWKLPNLTHCKVIPSSPDCLCICPYRTKCLIYSTRHVFPWDQLCVEL